MNPSDMAQTRAGPDRHGGASEPNEMAASPSDQISRFRRYAFKALAVLFVLFLLIGFGKTLLLAGINWLPDPWVFAIRPELGTAAVEHRLHGLVLTIFALGMIIGTATQLRHPTRSQAGILMAAAVPVAIALGELASGIYTVMGTAPLFLLIGLILVLHPARAMIFRFPVFDKTMVGISGAASLAWIYFAYDQTLHQRAGLPGDPHAAMDHWSWMASFGLLMVLWCLVGSMKRPGWRIAAWAAGLGAAAFGLQSLLFPGQASAAGVLPASAAILWAVAYLGTAQSRHQKQQSERHV